MTSTTQTHTRAPVNTSAVRLRDAGLAYHARVLWQGLDLDVRPGEFLTILGPNGSGKTSLLRVLLGLQPLTSGSAEVGGSRTVRGNPKIGYIPQQRALETTVTLRGVDLVGFGWDGHRWGPGLRGHRERKRRVDAAIRAVGAEDYAHRPLGLLSGGEQQRLRVAQSLVGNPAVLLCDEPLLSLDMAHQRQVSQLIAHQAKESSAAVLFVTHEINAVLSLVDRVLYFVDGQFRIGTVDEVINSETLSELYGTPIDVGRIGGRLVITGTDHVEQYHHVERS